MPALKYKTEVAIKASIKTIPLDGKLNIRHIININIPEMYMEPLRKDVNERRKIPIKFFIILIYLIFYL